MRGRGRGTGLLLAAGVLLLASGLRAGPAPQAAWPTIQKVELDAAYVSAGGVVHGAVRLDLPPRLPSEARLRVLAVRDVDVPDGKRAAAGRRTAPLLDRPLGAGTREVRFDLSAGDMLTGTMQVQAEVLLGKDAPTGARWITTTRATPFLINCRGCRASGTSRTRTRGSRTWART